MRSDDDARARLRAIPAPYTRRLVGPSGFVPVERVLQRPALRDDVVIRGELVDLLREHADVPVVLITGSPGFGKTTLTAEWDGEDVRPFTWLTADATCNDATVLVTYLALALQRVVDPDPGVVGALADNADVQGILLPRLGRMLSNLDTPFVLVIDDAGVLSAPEALEVITVMVDHLPPGSQIALVGRTSPDLRWSLMRAERRLLAIDEDQLRLTWSEAAAIVDAAGVDLSPDEVSTLLARTEGWPAGVYLAALSIRQQAEVRSPVSRFGGPGSVISDYLREELFAGRSADQRRFLVRTSLLTRVCASLCDAMLGTSDSDLILRELDRSNVFITSLGHDTGWYRYHHLFREMLVNELDHEDPAVVAQLHSRASAWLRGAGDIDGAIDHAIAANDVPRAAVLLCAQIGSCLGAGRPDKLRGWVETFTNEQVVSHTQLALTAAWCALDRGHAVDRWIDAAQHGIYDAREQDNVTAMLVLLKAHLARSGLQQMRLDARQASDLQAPENPWRPYADYLQAVAVLLAGAPDDARPMFEEAGRLAAALEVPVYRALCLAQLAFIALEGGRWDDARVDAVAAAQLVTDAGADDTPLVSIVNCVGALVSANEGRRDLAKRAARRSTWLVAVLNQSAPWLAVQTRYLLGRSHLLIGDTPAARVLLSEAQTHMHGVEDAEWLRERLDAAWTNVESFPLATGIGPSALTSAELRVLQLLPTHLSFEEIGKRLYVSRNTVKTQAIAAYRKLAVSSRAEAVARATAVGMIQS